MKAQATQIADWLKKLGMLCLAGLMLCNCARTILPDPARATLDGYIGHPVSEVILRFGPPKVSFGVGGGKMAFQWDQSVLGQSWATVSQEHQGECRLDAIIAIARPARPRAAPSDLQAWTVEAWRFSGAECV